MENNKMCKVIYSINMMAYLKMQNIDMVLDKADGLVFGLVEDSVDVNEVIDNYKADEALQHFLHTYQALRNEIKELKNS